MSEIKSMSDVIAAMYGGGGNSRVQPSGPADFSAPSRGDAIGGAVADRGPMGGGINWGAATVNDSSAGEIVDTPAGQYQVVQADNGRYELVPLEGAAQTFGGRSFVNLTHGQHHLGIDPETGQTYYQANDNRGRYFSDTNESYQTRLDQMDAAQADAEPPNPVVVKPPNPFVEPSDPISRNRPYVGGALSGSPFAAEPLQQLGFLKNQEKPQYMKMLNEALMGSLFKDLL